MWSISDSFKIAVRLSYEYNRMGERTGQVFLVGKHVFFISILTGFDAFRCDPTCTPLFRIQSSNTQEFKCLHWKATPHLPLGWLPQVNLYGKHLPDMLISKSSFNTRAAAGLHGVCRSLLLFRRISTSLLGGRWTFVLQSEFRDIRPVKKYTS